MAAIDVVNKIRLTARAMDTEMDDEGVKLFCHDLAGYTETQIIKALERTRRECSGRLKVAEVLNRIDDGRPGVEEAWSMIPRDEEVTAVMTDEMSKAHGVVSHMMHDEVAARMTFKEVYAKYVREAREARIPVRWFPSLGFDSKGREGPIREAVEKGRLTAEHADRLLPAPLNISKLLEGPNDDEIDREARLEKLAALKALLSN